MKTAFLTMMTSSAVLFAMVSSYHLYIKRRKIPRPALHLVGAGPGDPELLTLAAVRALQETDVVIADFLIPLELIQRFVRRRTVILVASNKTKGNAHQAQEELQKWTLDALKQGKDVVRLKGGDPFLYGRGGEEVVCFAQLGYAVEVIPGISSSLAGPLSAGIPVTMRGHADQFMVCTLHGKRDILYGVPEYRAQRTVVFLMSVSRIHLLVKQLEEMKYPLTTWVSVVERATNKGSARKLVGETIQTLLPSLEKFGLQSPSVIIVGGTADGAGLPESQWMNNGGVMFNAF